MNTIKEAVAERLSTIGPQVKETIIQSLVHEETQKRVEATQKALSQIQVLEKEIESTKPDQKMYNAEGNLVHEGFSQGKYQELTKKKEQLAKLTKAVEQALEGSDFKALLELTKDK